MLTAEQQYQNVALSQVQTNVQRFADSAELFRALGGGWWNGADPATLPMGAQQVREVAHGR